MAVDLDRFALSGDIESMARAWCAVHAELVELGMYNTLPEDERDDTRTGIERAIEFIRTLRED